MNSEMIKKKEVLDLLYKIKDNDMIPKNYGTILDIIRNIRDISAFSIQEDFEAWIQTNKELASNDWSSCNDERALGEMIAYDNVLEYLRSHGIVGGVEE